jgi:hypothetical protein
MSSIASFMVGLFSFFIIAVLPIRRILEHKDLIYNILEFILSVLILSFIVGYLGKLIFS